MPRPGRRVRQPETLYERGIKTHELKVYLQTMDLTKRDSILLLSFWTGENRPFARYGGLEQRLDYIREVLPS